MYKRGHQGIALLVLAPMYYVLLPDRPILAILLSGIMVIQALPDKRPGDQLARTPWDEPLVGLGCAHRVRSGYWWDCDPSSRGYHHADGLAAVSPVFQAAIQRVVYRSVESVREL